MSTFPFVQVEGALALPHIRPLARLPASFGREWALTPPHFSLRTELRALYAAIMRTVCLSAEAFRAAVGWGKDHLPAPQPPRPVAAPVAPAASMETVARESAARLSAGRAAHARNTPDASPTQLPPFAQRKLTGGAVAIGGAALLAWILASHAPHDTPGAAASAPSRPNANAGQDAGQDNSQRLANARAQHENVATGATARLSTPASAPAVVSSRTVAKPVQAPLAAPAQAPQKTIVDTRKPSQAVVSAQAKPDFSARAHAQPASAARLVQREAHGNGSERAAKRGSGQRVADRGTTVHRDVRTFAPYREAGPVTSHRALGAYSEAQGYSPRQTGANPADEYASILSYAKTYAPARASNSPAMPADSTEWVNHVSQRRITEVPDRFAK